MEQESKDNIAEITAEDLKNLHNSLKPFSGFYVTDMVEKLNQRKKELRQGKSFTSGVVLNILNGLVKNQLIRAAVLEEGAKLLLIYQDRVKKAKQQITSATTATADASF